ncbi:MAG: lmo0937 family membrane protein [Bacteroidetes bacterium]|nr:lmo0937 family membrane protein [Bacteroidota bacterium]
MGNILTIVAVILIIGWLVGFIGFGAAVGNFIHILLVLAIIAVLIRIISGRGV